MYKGIFKKIDDKPYIHILLNTYTKEVIQKSYLLKDLDEYSFIAFDNRRFDFIADIEQNYLININIISIELIELFSKPKYKGKRRLRGYIKYIDNKYYIFKSIRDAETDTIHRKTFYLKNLYNVEFLFQKNKGKRLEIEGDEYQYNNKSKLINIRIISTENFSYKEEERKTILSKFQEPSIFKGTFKYYKEKGKYYQALFENIYHNNELLVDHIFINIDYFDTLESGSIYLFTSQSNPYKKKYSNDIFFGLKDIQHKDIIKENSNTLY